MTEKSSRGPVNIIGAGLCGSLTAILLARRGYRVSVFERRADPRHADTAAGRSINLAMSARGIRALQHAGIFADVEPLLLPMRGRLIHKEDGASEFLRYGHRDDELIWSVSRADLNRLLIEKAAACPGVSLRFRQEAVDRNRQSGSLHMQDNASGQNYLLGDGPVVAADGAGSAVRRGLQHTGIVTATESFLPHGYKELAVPATAGGQFRLRPDALHIWPRGEFMLIALPNPGGDFTLTLFLPTQGKEGFAGLDQAPKIRDFFARHFADVAPLIPQVAETFLKNPVGILGTVHCRPWRDGNALLLIGDAAHAIVPFHGQGMNLAFEDCRLLDELLENADLRQAFGQFENRQRENADAIAEMALENYVEMRDTVRDPGFALRKQLSFELEKRLPDIFIPRYSMVMFHDEIPYAVARKRGAVQEQLLAELAGSRHSLEDIDLDAAAVKVRAALPPVDKRPVVSR